MNVLMTLGVYQMMSVKEQKNIFFLTERKKISRAKKVTDLHVKKKERESDYLLFIVYHVTIFQLHV